MCIPFPRFTLALCFGLLALVALATFARAVVASVPDELKQLLAG